MASVSLVSSPQTPVLDKNMSDSELAGDEREDGELEDGEIDDEGIGIEEEKEPQEAHDEQEKDPKERDVKDKDKDKERDDKAHRHSRKRYKKAREKHKSKRRRRDRQKHHSPSSGSSSDSYDSDYDRPEKPKTRKGQGSNQEPNGQSSQRGRESRGGLRGASQRKPPLAKGGDVDKYSEYGNDKYDYEGEEEDYEEDGTDFHTESGGFGGGGGGGGGGQGRGRHGGKDQMKRANQRGLQKQQPHFGQRGRGRGNAVGRGRGMMKNKKLKGKGWGGRGRDQGGDQGMEGGPQHPQDGKNSFHKKRPIMSKEFINQHTVEHNGRYICKYFLEGRCIKGEQCKFEHELVVPDKKKELCKFYLQGYCSKGDNCIYMHNEYPCKFFHTGAKCYQGDHCKFSHDSLNDVTKDLLDKIISTEEENAHEDEIELENLRKQGIAPLPKPPPGVGLLPTPGQGSPEDAGQSGKKIPSLFEIKVQPTVDLAQKIGLSGGSKFSPGGEFDEEASDQFAGETEETEQGGAAAAAAPPGSGAPPGGPPPETPGPMAHPATGPPPGPLSPPGQQPPPLHGFPMPPPPPFLPGQPPPFMGNRPPMSTPPPMSMGPRPPFPPMPDLQMLQSLFPFPPMGQNPVELFSNFLRSQAMAQGVDPSVSFLQNLQQQMGAESQMQSLPPAVQKALFLHITQQQQQQQHNPAQPPHQQGADLQRGEALQDKASIRDETTNWYSSDEEDGGCVSSILKSLKKQNEMHQRAQAQLGGPPPQPAPPTGDPRLLKERAPPSDPRVKMDPRQRHADPKKEADGASDPRLARDPRKVRAAEPAAAAAYRQQRLPSAHKPPAGAEDDEEGERELRERATLIPLDPGPGALLRDPRSQLQQFSHIRVDILLQRPAFADAVVWGPEDLLPSLVPKQEHSINLPLPPLIADAQKNRVNLLEPPPSHAAPTAIDPRAVAARLKEGVVRMPPSRNLETRSSAERPLDPRQLKALDPRMKRTGSLDSKPPLQKEGSAPGGGGGGTIDPRLPKSGAGPSPGSAPAVRSKPKAEELPPYAPRLASSTGVGLESPTTLLGGISLYDPRQPSAEQAHKEPVEAPKKTGILKHHAVKKDAKQTAPPPPSTPPQPPPPSSSARSPPHPRGPAEEGRTADSASNSSPPHRRSPGALSPGPAPPSPVKPPAVHNLPVQTLAGLNRPQYGDPRQARPGGPGAAAPLPGDAEDSKGEPAKKVEEVEEEKAEEVQEQKEGPQEEAGAEMDDDRTLKDVFKTFDPTASPFCQ